MKKNLIFMVIGITIGLIFVVAGANYLYNAKEVSYKSTTVEAAINNLYDISDNDIFNSLLQKINTML